MTILGMEGEGEEVTEGSHTQFIEKNKHQIFKLECWIALSETV